VNEIKSAQDVIEAIRLLAEKCEKLEEQTFALEKKCEQLRLKILHVMWSSTE